MFIFFDRAVKIKKGCIFSVHSALFYDLNAPASISEVQDSLDLLGQKWLFISSFFH